jgi:ubiquinone/menaquinone biosynthesis C-methylase UbiE
MRSIRFRVTVSILALAIVSGAAAQQRDPKQYQQTLENPDRLTALQVDRVIGALGLTDGMRIADLGAGTGVFTLPLAEAVGPGGKVYAIDVDAGLLDIVSGKAKAAGGRTIQTIVAGETDPRLPEPVDLLFICDTLHHLPNQAEYVKQFARLLRPGGRVVVIDFKAGAWPAGHESFAITPAQVDAWMKAAGFTRSATQTFLETNFFHIYRLNAA